MNTLPLDAHYEDLRGALDFAKRRVKNWRADGLLNPRQEEDILERLERRERIWEADQKEGLSLPPNTGLPPMGEGESPAAKSLRYWIFLLMVIEKMEDARILSMRQGHNLSKDVAECAAHLRRRVNPAELARIQDAERRILGEVRAEAMRDENAPAQHSGRDRGRDPLPDGRSVDPSRPSVPPPLPRTMMEILLDPRNLQWLMAAGGVLMAVGLVILLWVNELMTPPTLAIVMGVVNVGLLGLGWFVLRSTTKQIAGRGLTLLACLIMPLNLWYYHANEILTVSGGLWAAGAVIALLYLVSALILRDETFVYVFCIGVTMTGLLFLASLPSENQPHWKIALPALLLVVLGLIGIHLERLFPEGEGPFTRRHFGLAFFWSGHVQMGVGLLLVLAAQIAGDWLDELFFPLGNHGPWGAAAAWRGLALAMFAVGTYAYIYSDLVVRKVGWYAYAAALTLICAMVVALRIAGLTPGLDVWVIVFSVVALAVTAVWVNLPTQLPATRPLPWFGLFLLMVSVALGFSVYVRAISLDLRSVWAVQPPGWSYVAALAVAAIASRGNAFLLRRDPGLTATYFFVTGAATLLAVTATLAALGLDRWSEHAPLLMVLPILYIVAAHLYRGHSPAQPLLWVSHAAAAIMLVSSLASTVEGFVLISEAPLNLVLAGFFAEVFVFYLLALILHRQTWAVYGAAAMLAAAVWQLLTFAAVAIEVYVVTFALLGLVMLIGYRLDLGGKLDRGPWAEGLFQSAHTFLSLALIVAVFLGLSRLLLSRQLTWGQAELHGFLALICLLTLTLIYQQAWRGWYLVMSITQGFFCFLSLVALTELTGWQKAELFTVLAGLLLLVVGHVGWFRERERERDLVTLTLLLGSLLLVVPLAIATMIDRWHNHFLLVNELGFLAASVLLLVTGVLFRLRSTTITGSLFSAIYFFTLLFFVPWSRLNTIAIFIVVGGGTIFFLGLVLSLFRERLVRLGDQIQRREGIFQVLTWR